LDYAILENHLEIRRILETEEQLKSNEREIKRNRYITAIHSFLNKNRSAKFIVTITGNIFELNTTIFATRCPAAIQLMYDPEELPVVPHKTIKLAS